MAACTAPPVKIAYCNVALTLFVLTAENGDMVYVPEGCGHGFLTLQNETEVFYQISEFYHPELARGVRWNDPAFQIPWPEPVEVISERDRTYPDFQEIACTC